MTVVGEPKHGSLPEELSSSTAKLVYLYLRTAGDATPDQLQSALGVKKLTLFPVLHRLETEGFIETVDGGGSYSAIR
ncbi:MarR family transcriptional regulator [Halalkalicoccus tibetensis]|uniref:MarR family transcriptional regulator n=1 Tax=Halalkalicoccus tibetensis TaxID=175632 RepID=A0ABD5V5N3_9EURY